ncbi:MAG: DNA primase [Oscillospiraceae bacterium]|nr:DNA primase [Oscillospiraceae bacterium]
MTKFEQIKASVPLPDAAERYGLKVSRNGMARCPFHDDHRPSMKLYDDHFYCFGCQRSGDVITLASELLRLPGQAADQLIQDFGLSIQDTRHSPSKKAQRSLQKERLCLSVLQNHLRLCRERKRRFAPTSSDDPIDPSYEAACKKEGVTAYYLDLMICGSREERQELAAFLEQDGILQRMEEDIQNCNEEKNHESTP